MTSRCADPIAPLPPSCLVDADDSRNSACKPIPRLVSQRLRCLTMS